MKNVMDVVIAALLVLILFPVFLIIISIVLWQFGLPLFEKLAVTGLNGKSIYLLNFRTSQIKKDDSEIKACGIKKTTWFGEFLHHSRLAALPWLINVIRGELSLVGPTPQPTEYVSLCNLDLVRRYHVKPGITGWMQIHGSKDMIWKEAYEMDVWYVDHKSIKLDIYILWATIRKHLSLPYQHIYKKSAKSGDGVEKCSMYGLNLFSEFVKSIRMP